MRKRMRKLAKSNFTSGFNGKELASKNSAIQKSTAKKSGWKLWHRKCTNFPVTKPKMYCSRLSLCQSKTERITYTIFPISSAFSFPLPLFYKYTRKGNKILLMLRYDLLTPRIFKITHVHGVVTLHSTFFFSWIAVNRVNRPIKPV